MKTTELGFLFGIGLPLLYVGFGEPERAKWNASHFYSCSRPNVCVRRLRGQKMRSVGALMDEIGAAFQFFEGFGENWHALEECLGYLDEWLPADAYVLVVENAEEVLRDEAPDQMAAFLKSLEGAGLFWSKPVDGNGRFDRKAVPFHVLLNVSVDATNAVESIVSVALGAGVQVGILGAQ